MATIKQITKQLETANKRVADFTRKIAMYQDRLNKAIDKANKNTGLNITIADIEDDETNYHGHILHDYHLRREIANEIGFDSSFRIDDNFRYIKENEKHLENERRNIERLQSELAALEAQAKADADSYNNTLEAGLRSAMADFRVVWFTRMIGWHGNHFDIIKKRTPSMKARRERLGVCLRYFLGREIVMFSVSNKHRRIIKFLELEKSICNHIINDEVNRYDDKSAYLDDVQKELEKSWERGIVNLTKKCQVYGVDESRVSTLAPTMTQKGFEVIIQDGKPRVIHARVIWAAEYSDIVQPHTRYIVTERATK